MRTLSRMTVAGAAALTLLLAPAGAATAQAVSTTPTDHRDSAPSITLTPEQRATVLAARKTYIETAAGIRTAYRSAVAGILETVQTSTASAELAYQVAKDAYVLTRVTGGSDADVAAAKTALDNAQSAYRSALDAAKAKAKPDLDAAKSKARTDLDNAKTAYVNTVTGAVPNAPAWLLVPPGGGKSWISHGFGKDAFMGMGMHR